MILRLLAIAWCMGCPKAPPRVPGADLPEQGASVAARDPAEILDEAAGELEPSHRGNALYFLILASAEPAGGSWGPRALFDPDGWVQRQGAAALLARADDPEARALLVAWIANPSGDPYSRGFAGVRLRAPTGPDAAVRDAAGEAWRAETQPWRQAPLALAALVHGDDDARAPLSAALARGDIALEPEFLLDLGRSGRVDLLAGLREGADWVEEELALAWAVARLGLGDAAAEQLLRKALSSPSEGTRMEVLEHLAALPGPEADALLRRAGGSTGRAKDAARLALAARSAQPAETIAEVSRSGDPALRALALQRASDALAGVGGPPPGRKQVRQLEALLDAGLADPHPGVRRAALDARRRHGLPDDRAPITAMLTDDALELRIQAAGALLTEPRAR